MSDLDFDLTELLQPQRIERLRQVLSQRTRQVTVLLEALHKGHNQSAILRSCDSFGVQDVHIIESPTCKFRPHSSMTQGADKWLTLHRYKEPGEAVQALREAGYTLWASFLGEDTVPLYEVDLTQRVALIFGSEKDGITQELKAQCDGCFMIPMLGFSQSFNVSVAAAIALYEAVEQRRKRYGRHGDLSADEIEALFERYVELSVDPRVLAQRNKES